jgi:aromatic ring-cleaving dioxygenase
LPVHRRVGLLQRLAAVVAQRRVVGGDEPLPETDFGHRARERQTNRPSVAPATDPQIVEHFVRIAKSSDAAGRCPRAAIHANRYFAAHGIKTDRPIGPHTGTDRRAHHGGRIAAVLLVIEKVSRFPLPLLIHTNTENDPIALSIAITAGDVATVVGFIQPSIDQS